MTIDQIISGIIDREGGYSNNPNDAGGATMYGITEKVARASGYFGEMKSLPRSTAEKIYRDTYYLKPGFDRLPDALAEEVTDTGVNMGVGTAVKLLQRALGALSPVSLTQDGVLGEKTLDALQSFLGKRGQEGERVLLKALNGLQAERYIALAESRPQNKEFIYGWLRNRC